NPGKAFLTITNDFKIPESWIWAAKALEARAVAQDFALEIDYLQKAGDWNTAHERICGVVAPRCVIEEDWVTLRRLLEGFEVEAVGKETWEVGGKVYLDYLDVIEGKGSESEIEGLLEGLLEVLPAVKETRGTEWGFEEGVAVREMSGKVAEMVMMGGVKNVSSAPFCFSKGWG
ncbi:MAG: hypothetical protein Q9183_004402, partial [Haloplaca sp. 2 TL-2023]